MQHKTRYRKRIRQDTKQDKTRKTFIIIVSKTRAKTGQDETRQDKNYININNQSSLLLIIWRLGLNADMLDVLYLCVKAICNALRVIVVIVAFVRTPSTRHHCPLTSLGPVTTLLQILIVHHLVTSRSPVLRILPRAPLPSLAPPFPQALDQPGC